MKKQFQSLIGTLQTRICSYVHFRTNFVSIPYRYATNYVVKLNLQQIFEGFNPL